MPIPPDLLGVETSHCERTHLKALVEVLFSGCFGACPDIRFVQVKMKVPADVVLVEGGCSKEFAIQLLPLLTAFDGSQNLLQLSYARSCYWINAILVIL